MSSLILYSTTSSPVNSVPERLVVETLFSTPVIPYFLFLLQKRGRGNLQVTRLKTTTDLLAPSRSFIFCLSAVTASLPLPLPLPPLNQFRPRSSSPPGLFAFYYLLFSFIKFSDYNFNSLIACGTPVSIFHASKSLVDSGLKQYPAVLGDLLSGKQQ